MDKLLSKYSLDELKQKLKNEKEKKVNNQYIPFLKEKGIYYHEYKEPKISGELFEPYPDYPMLKISNLGRVMYEEEILPQEPESDDHYDYLWVKVPNHKWFKVYELVAKTFLDKPPSSKYKIIHHISNNGFDNRVENLMYVTCEQHRELHDFGSWYCSNKHECDKECKFYN